LLFGRIEQVVDKYLNKVSFCEVDREEEDLEVLISKVNDVQKTYTHHDGGFYQLMPRQAVQVLVIARS